MHVSKITGWILFVLASSGQLSGCNAQPKQFKTIIKIPTSPLKDQQGTGLCWSYATTSFLETEALRLGKDPVHLSPVFYVPFAYQQKAITFLQQQGKTYFGSGDLTFTVLDAYRQIGALPEDVYTGNLHRGKSMDHTKMDEEIEAYMKTALVRSPDSVNLLKDIQHILYQTVPLAPDSFWYKDGFYNAREFADRFVGINPDDYVEITSFSHHPFYQKVALEVPANWKQYRYLNLPIEDFLQVIDSALYKGFGLCWDGDAREPRFNYKTGLMELDEVQEDQVVTQAWRQREYLEKKNDRRPQHAPGGYRYRPERQALLHHEKFGGQKQIGRLCLHVKKCFAAQNYFCDGA